MSIRVVLLLLGVSICVGCDSGTEWKDGPYRVVWIDTDDDISLLYDDGVGYESRVAPIVVAVGSNEQYVVAEQVQSRADKEGVYFVIDKREDDVGAPNGAVIGPLSQSEFDALVMSLGLPKLEPL